MAPRIVGMLSKKANLGKGLEALISQYSTEKDSNYINDSIPLNKIKANPHQPRKDFDDSKMKELILSVKEKGILQPIAVRELENGDYEIIAGERRWLAAQNAGLHEIPVVITEADDLKSLEFAIVENVQRHDLNSIEEANGYQKLIDEFGYDQEKVATFIGRSRSHISNCLRLLTLPKEVIALIENGNLSQGHAKVLVGLENALFVAKKIIDKKLSVRQAENLVRIFKTKSKSKYILKDPNLKQLESELINKIGLNVSINNKKNNSGSIFFEYKNLDQLNRIIEIIKINY